MIDWAYESWASGEPYDWKDAGRGSTIYDAMDFHVDLGCGKVKKGRIGVDMFPAPGVNVVMDLETLIVRALCDVPGEDARLLEATWEGMSGPPRPVRPTMEREGLGLPFPSGSIKSIISHHCLEHVRSLVPLIDEVWRVLEPGGIFYPITPLFPSRTAVEDPLHVRYFMEGSWQTWCGGVEEGSHWYESFAVVPFKARFEKLHEDHSPPTPIHEQWGPADARELRVALRCVK